MSRHLLLLCLVQLTGCGSCISTTSAPPVPPPIPIAPFGRFDGQVIAAWDDDGRFMTLRDKFIYIDANNKTWLAPAGAHVNGASIPQAFWSIIGGPFEGQYRNASVVHDVYCETMTEPWEAVHEMFYHACRCGGVEESKAKMLYWAVYHFGPRWETPRPFATGSQSKSGDPRIAFAPTRFTLRTADESTASAAAEYFAPTIRLSTKSNNSILRRGKLHARKHRSPRHRWFGSCQFQLAAGSLSACARF